MTMGGSPRVVSGVKASAQMAGPVADTVSLAAGKGLTNPAKTLNNFINDFQTYYHAGVEAEIYFGDVFIDEISGLSIAVLTNKAPLYGYASELFDAVARGNLIVQGSFSINYVHKYYLQIIAEEIKEAKEGKTAQRQDAFTFGIADNAMWRDRIKMRSLMRGLTSLSNEEFKRVATHFNEDKLDTKGVDRGNLRFDHIAPFDIYIAFGDPSLNNRTVRIIKNVYLTSSNIVLSPSGEPVQEAYSFIARVSD